MPTVPCWFALLLAACLGAVSTREISDCEGRTMGFSEFSSPDCAYNWVYCDGESSYFCLDQDCQMEFECVHPVDDDDDEDEQTTTVIGDDPKQPLTSPSIIYTTPPTLTTTTTKTTTRKPQDAQQTNVREICVVGITDYYPYPANCNYYYQCHHGRIYLQQCPLGWQYSSAAKKCILVSPYDKQLCQWLS